MSSLGNHEHHHPSMEQRETILRFASFVFLFLHRGTNDFSCIFPMVRFRLVDQTQGEHRPGEEETRCRDIPE